MNRHPATPAAVLIGVVLAAAASGCAPTPSPAPAATVPATLPAAPTRASTAASTVTAEPFTPTAVPTGRAGIPADGLPPATTLTSSDPDVVATAGLTAYYRADTALDLGPADTHRRALPWTTGQLAAGIRGDRPVTGPGADWTTLATHHGYAAVTVARAYDDGAPTDTRNTVYREFTVTTRPRGRDGWTGAALTYTGFLTLARNGGGWRITTLRDDR